VELDRLVHQLPPPLLLLGDFNAHSELWGSEEPRPSGRVVEDFIAGNDLSILNTGSQTYLHPASGSFTVIDLSLCSPSAHIDFTWEVDTDQHGSDHFPIFISSECRPSLSHPKWVFKRADWTAFGSLCEIEITEDIFEDVDDPLDIFTTLLIKIAHETIPKSCSSTKCRKPWYTDECKKAIRLRRAALQKFRHHPNDDNLLSYRKAQAVVRRVIKASKRASWKNYISKLTIRSSVKKTWDMVRKISGKYKGHQIHHLTTRSGDTATDKESIAEALADEFALNSSTSHYTDKFQKYKDKAERKVLNFNSNNTESYNLPFTLLELLMSLKSSHDTSVGPDDIHYQLLKHLPINCKMILLNLFNRIWVGEPFPSAWRNAIVIAIPKPGKDISLPTNYRPIALTSCLCKTMERMVNGRLVYFLEYNNFLSPSQSGFRSQRSTADHLVSLETYIRDGFAHGDHVLSVFFDLEKAYDTTWKCGIISDLFSMGLRGHLPVFIRNFLSHRQFSVRLGSVDSSPHPQEMGVPQGCVLSVTLFNIKINSITSAVGADIHKCLYVDDFTISYRSRYLPTAERKIQLALNGLQKWADESGFRFSPTKTVSVCFSGRRGIFPDPLLTLNGQKIPIVEKTKFLGVIFDKKLNFKEHIQFLRGKCQKVLNLLRVISKMNWGADREVLLRLFRSLLRSRLDYGAIVYGSARISYLERLKPIQNQALRLCLGAFRTSPVTSLHTEANEMPMAIRQKLLSVQFALRVCSDTTNPAHQCIFNYNNDRFYLSKPNAIRPLALRIKEDLQTICPDIKAITPNQLFNTPYWLLRPPELDISLIHFGKKTANPNYTLKNEFYNLMDKYPDHKVIFTDGSKSDSAVACSATADNLRIQIRLPDSASIFSAELLAIYQVLTLLECSANDQQQFLIATDSLSSLQAIGNFNIKHPYVFKILEKCTLLHKKGIYLVMAWCPSHVGVMGNERADLLAKEALSFTTCTIRIPSSDFKPITHEFFKEKWQEQWSSEQENKLYCIQPTLGKWAKSSREIRREEIVLARARIGHSHLTHGYLLRREIPPVCMRSCQSILSVKHIFIECVDFDILRRRFFNVSSMKQLFEEVNPSKILSYLKEIGLFYQF
jgi:ribonuclease HI